MVEGRSRETAVAERAREPWSEEREASMSARGSRDGVPAVGASTTAARLEPPMMPEREAERRMLNRQKLKR